MRRSPTQALLSLLTLSLLAPVSADAGQFDATRLDYIEPSGEVLDENDLLLVEVVLDRLAITDSLPLYASPVGLLIPVGELSRLLDADLNVQLGEKRIVGTIGEARRSVVADLANGIVRVDGNLQLLMPGDMIVGANDI